MLRNYFKTALRNLRNNPTFSFINLSGLALGTLCCLYIVLYVEDQYSYDKQHKNVNDIYRIDSKLGLSDGGDVTTTAASPPIAPQLKNDFAAVEQYTRIVPPANFGVKEHTILYKDKVLTEKDVVFADSTFFDLFTWHFTNGTPSRALSEPFSVVLLKPTADRIFGSEDPIGKMITINNDYGKHDFKVTGVVDESLGKSQVHANIFMSMNSNGIGYFTYYTDRWAGENMAYSFVRLRPKTDPNQLERQFPAFVKKYAGDQLKDLGMKKTLLLEPVRAMHFNTVFQGGLGKTVDPSFLRMLLLIAGLIQVIACINFMNLSTARASRRAKEVGVRKVLGADRKELVKQFLGESFLLAFTGTILAIPLLIAALPFLNNITGADIRPTLLADWNIWVIMAGLIATTGLIAGSYPAFYLSAFRAIKVIKGNFSNHVSASGIRRSLVVFQFALSILMVTAIIIIYSQLHFIQHKDLGFDQNQKLIFDFRTESSITRMDGFMNDLRQLPEVKAVGKGSNYPSQNIGNDWSFFKPGGDVGTSLDVPLVFTDDQFLKACGIRLVSGRLFQTTDTDKVIINENLAKGLGLKVGQFIVPLHNPPMEIVGVMKDINYHSLHQDIGPLLLWYAPRGHSGWGVHVSHAMVNVNTPDYKNLIAKVEAVWHRDLPDEPFEVSFLSDEVQHLYETEITLSNILNTFAFIAVFISCLGLFGLAAFSAERRTKEIGVRKVLGASVPGIVRLLSTDFLKLVGIAFVLAVPPAIWIMHNWLQGFHYRTHIEWWMPALAGAMAFIVALATVSTQAIRAATVNPIRSLRTD